jgi:MFS family permease
MSPTGWRWVFYFNAIFFGLTGILLAIFYAPPPPKLRRENSLLSEFKSFDFIGMALFLSGIIGLVVSLTWGGNIYPWSSPRVIATLVVALCFLAGFGCYGTSYPGYTLPYFLHVTRNLGQKGRSLGPSLPSISKFHADPLCWIH